MKRNPHFDPTASIKPHPSMDHSQFNQLKTCLFLKYFPKYLRNFELSSKAASVKSKVKRTKVIRNFTAPFLHSSSEWRLLLLNKVKFFKTLNNTSQSPIQFIEKINLFTQLTSIRFSFPEHIHHLFENYRIKRSHLVRACKKIKRLRNVKALKIINHPNPDAAKRFIQELNSASRLLNCLKTLDIYAFGFYCNPTGQLLNLLKNGKNLLKQVTSLHLATLESPSHLKDFQSLENSCPNLTHLSLELSCRSVTYTYSQTRRFSSFCFPVAINYLSALKTFHNLKSLDLQIADTFTFLKDFVAPSSLQSLLLNFKECLTKTILCRIAPRFTDTGDNYLQIFNFFEENQALVRIYDNFHSLNNLQVLKIFISQDFNLADYKYQHLLLHNILRRTPSLKQLMFVGGGFDQDLNERFQFLIKDFYLPQFFESCHHFSQILQHLEFGNEKIILSNFDLSSSRNKFPSLFTIKTTGRFDDPNVDIRSFIEEILTLGDSITILQLNTFVTSNTKSFLSLLNQLNQLKRPSNLKRIELQIKFSDFKFLSELEFDLKDLTKELHENRKGYPKLQGVALNISMTQSYSKQLREILFAYGKKFDDFYLRVDPNNLESGFF